MNPNTQSSTPTEAIASDEVMSVECPFCNFDKSKILYDYADVIVFEPLNPVVEGHLLVVPIKHVVDFTDDAQVTGHVMEVASLVAGMNGGDYNLITSKGKSATQSVFHLHVHLVPREKNDGLTLPWTEVATRDAHIKAEYHRELVRAIDDKIQFFEGCAQKACDATTEDMKRYEQPSPQPNNLPHIVSMVIEQYKARKLFGMQKYGVPLQPFNGRDALQDAKEEAMDMVLYLTQEQYERAHKKHLLQCLRTQLDNSGVTEETWKLLDEIEGV
jgi:histidine triad (HIT) family protein